MRLLLREAHKRPHSKDKTVNIRLRRNGYPAILLIGNTSTSRFMVTTHIPCDLRILPSYLECVWWQWFGSQVHYLLQDARPGDRTVTTSLLQTIKSHFRWRCLLLREIVPVARHVCFGPYGRHLTHPGASKTLYHGNRTTRVPCCSTYEQVSSQV